MARSTSRTRREGRGERCVRPARAFAKNVANHHLVYKTNERALRSRGYAGRTFAPRPQWSSEGHIYEIFDARRTAEATTPATTDARDLGRGLALSSRISRCPRKGASRTPWRGARRPLVRRSSPRSRPCVPRASTRRGRGVEHVGPRWRLRALVPVPSRPNLSSLALFVAATFQAASRRPSVVVRFSPPSTPSPRAPRSLRAAVPNPRLVRDVRAECSLPIRTETPTHAFPRPFPPILPSLRSPSRPSLFSAPSASPRASVPRVRPDSPDGTACGDWSSPSQPPSSRASASCRRATPPSDPIGPDDAYTATRSDGPDSRNSPARDSTSRNSCPSSSSSAAAAALCSPSRRCLPRRRRPGSPPTPTDASATRTDSAASVWVFTLHHLRRRPRGPFPRLRVYRSRRPSRFLRLRVFRISSSSWRARRSTARGDARPADPLSARRIRNAARRRRGWFARWRGGDANRRRGGVAAVRSARRCSTGFLAPPRWGALARTSRSSTSTNSPNSPRARTGSGPSGWDSTCSRRRTDRRHGAQTTQLVALAELLRVSAGRAA